MALISLAVVTTEINLPRNEVFDYLVNMENFAKWFPGVLHIRADNELGFCEPGKTYLERVKLPFRGVTHVSVELVECRFGESFVTQGDLPRIRPEMHVHLQDADKGCWVQWQMFSRNGNPFFHLFMLPMVKHVMQKRASYGMQKLKKILES